MNFDQVVLIIGTTPIRLSELLLAAAALALFLLIFLSLMAWRNARLRAAHERALGGRTLELETRLAEMAGQLRQFAEANSVRDAHMAKRLDDRLDQVSHRLGQGLSQSTQTTGEHLQKLNERLAVIDTAQANLTALSSEMISLKDILANKQSRGAYGQARMEAIIRDGLPANAYSFQASLSNKSRPDCLIRLPDSEVQIVIDAKFPLEALSAFKSAAEMPEKNRAIQQLKQDMTKHINDIADKYLIFGETHDSAIMFVPSESVYADLHEHFEDLVQKAHRRNVIIASPNILMLLVQTMLAIFKDARMREQAGVIQIEVRKLLDDVERLKTRTQNLKKHFDQAGTDIDNMLISSDKITKRGHKIDQLDLHKKEGRENDPPPQPLSYAES